MTLVEIIPVAQSDLGAQNARQRQQQFAGLQQIAPEPTGAPFPRVGVLGAGDYKGGTLSGTVDVTGINSPRVVGDVTLTGTVVVRGVVFGGEVTIGAQATASLVTCRFLKPVNVIAGGRVACTGCRFDGTAAILNAGVAADAATVGSVRTSGVAHVNATIVAEV